jgi:hypothetical protein
MDIHDWDNASAGTNPRQLPSAMNPGANLLPIESPSNVAV